LGFSPTSRQEPLRATNQTSSSRGATADGKNVDKLELDFHDRSEKETATVRPTVTFSAQGWDFLRSKESPSQTSIFCYCCTSGGKGVSRCVPHPPFKGLPALCNFASLNWLSQMSLRQNSPGQRNILYTDQRAVFVCLCRTTVRKRRGFVSFKIYSVLI